MLLQGVKIRALESWIAVRIDTADLLIGEQTKLYLTITTDKGKTVYWPIPADTLMAGVEILSVSALDTTEIDNNRIEIKHDILVTSFDSALYLLPPFMLVDNGDTTYSEQVALKVSTIPVNTDAPNEFFDIKDVWKPPFVWADYYPLILGIILFIVLAAAIFYIVKRLKNRKSLIPFKKAEPLLPPHEEAVKRLDVIKQQKLWQQGKNKEYYTQITDTLRYYIFRCYGVNAMEMTTNEILDIIKGENDARQVYDTLKQILLLADFVKFAKLHPLPDENDLSLKNAYLFVNQTKQAEPVKLPEESRTEQATDGETNQSNSAGGETV
jgi:large-conductance mechanosensitive channel